MRDTEQLDEGQLLLQRLHGACATHVKRIGYQTVTERGMVSKEYIKSYGSHRRRRRRRRTQKHCTPQ